MIILSFVLAFIVMLVGFAFALLVTPPLALTIALSALTALSLILLLANAVAEKSFFKWMQNKSVAEKQAYTLRHKEEVRHSYDETLGKLTKLRHLTSAYAVLILICAIATALLGGIALTLFKPLAVLLTFWAGVLLLSVIIRAKKPKPYKPEADDVILSREEYPKIYALADRAAEQLGCRKKLTIILIPNCNASMLRTKDTNYIILGSILLSILNDDELYCVFLHELSHASAKHAALFREREYGERVNAIHSSEGGPYMIIKALFAGFDARYYFNLAIFELTASVVLEEDADADVARYGDKAAGASVMLKLAYDTKYSFESDAYDFEPFFAPEEHPLHATRDMAAKFKARIDEMHELWDELIYKEILANNASHPTTRMRLEALGYDKAELILGGGSPEYLAEVDAAVELMDKTLYEQNKEGFAEGHQKRYLTALAEVEKWEGDGKPVIAGKYEDVVSALMYLGRVSEGEDLCDRAIASLPETSSAFAIFKKASLLIWRYDHAGVDLMYRAIELNHNYIEDGLSLIGSYLCFTGNEEELRDYRARSVDIAQKDVDESSKLDYLSRTDKLTRDDMPPEMLEDILSYMHSLDEKGIINRVFLVKKTVSESFFASVFVIHFYGGTDEERRDIMHGIFRYLDSYPVEKQFALFDYFEYPDVKVEKIEGSLVYEKRK
jgi:Zn-dependent protease with chaperone function